MNNSYALGKQIPFSSACLSIVYCIISVSGISGNALVIYVILKDKKMPMFPTNIFILNMAMADLVIMLIGVEEIVHYIVNQGWLLGSAACKIFRSGMTTCFYASVLNLMAVCIERYIAIIFPLKAQIWCSKRRIVILLITIWTIAILCGIPTAFFVDIFNNNVHIENRNHSIEICIRSLSRNKTIHFKNILIFNTIELSLYYFIPIVTQIILYTKIYQTLFKNDSSNHQRLLSLQNHNRKRKSFNEDPKSIVSEIELININTIYDGCYENYSPLLKAITRNNCKTNISCIKTRKQVVKMLIACVSTYFICYSPNVLTFVYNLKYKTVFSNSFLYVLIMTLSYTNSAANPILYSIFSKRFRTKFQEALRCF